MRQPRTRSALAGTLGALTGIAVCAGVVWLASGAEPEFSDRRSQHFELLQDAVADRYGGVDGSRRFERTLLQVLEAAHDAVRDAVQLAPRGRIRAVLYAPEHFDGALAPRFPFRIAGFYDGALHVRGARGVSRELVRTLHHEYVHAAVHTSHPSARLPGWFHEGLAEYFAHRADGRALPTQAEFSALRAAARDDTWIPLSKLRPRNFAHLEPGRVGLAYTEAFVAVLWLAQREPERRLGDAVERAAVVRPFERVLERIYGVTTAELDRQLRERYR